MAGSLSYQDEVLTLLQDIASGITQGIGVSRPYSSRPTGGGSLSGVSFGDDVLSGISDNLRTTLDGLNDFKKMLNNTLDGFVDKKISDDIAAKSKVFNEAMEALRESIETNSGKIAKEDKIRRQAIENAEKFADEQRKLIKIEEENILLKAQAGTIAKDEANRLLDEQKALKQINEELLKEERDNAQKAFEKNRNDIITQGQQADAEQNVAQAATNLNQRWNTSEVQAGERQQQEIREREVNMQRRVNEWRDSFNESDENARRRAEAKGARALVYKSGIGKTWFGKAASRVADYQENMLGISNLGGAMKTYGKNMASAADAGVFAKGLGKTFTGLGKVVGSTSKLFTKLAGPIGWIIEAVKFAMSTYGRHLQFQADLRNADTDLLKNMGQLAVSGINLSKEQASAYIGMTSGIAQARRTAGAGDVTEGHGMLTGLYADAVSNVVGSIFGDINKAAYEAAKTAINFTGDVEKLKMHSSFREKQAEVTAGSLSAGYNARKDIWKTEMTEGKMLEGAKMLNDYQNQQMELWQKAGIDQMAMHAAFGENQKMYEKFLTSMKGMSEKSGGMSPDAKAFYNNVLSSDIRNKSQQFGAAGVLDSDLGAGLVADLQSRNARALAQYEINYNLKMAKMERDATIAQQTAQATASLEQIRLNAEQTVAEQTIDAAKKIREAYLNLAQNVEDLAGKIDEYTTNVSIGMGYLTPESKLSFQKNQMEIARDVGGMWNMKPEEIFSIQKDLNEKSGRTRLLSKEEVDNVARMTKVMGDLNSSKEFVNNMQIFNKSVNSSANAFGIIAGRVARMGLDMKKFGKTLNDNMKLAMKFNFKDGTTGLMRMTAWAEKTRFNMESLSGMIEKAQEGGLEGIIQQSAGFQVLGGHAAMNSDPLGMLYDAWADPEAYAKRMQDMTTGFGTFNKRTGETEFNVNESMQIAQIAKLQGRTTEELRAEIMERNKKESINKQMSPEQLAMFDETQRTAIANKSHYDEESGRWKVTVLENGQQVEKDVSDLNETDMQNLAPEGYEENVLRDLEDIRSAVGILQGENVWEQVDATYRNFEEYMANQIERAQTAHDTYMENREKYDAEIKEGMRLASESYSNMVDIMKRGNKEVDEQANLIKVSAGNLQAGINSTASIVAAGAAKLAAGFSAVDHSFDAILEGMNEIIRQVQAETGQLANIKTETYMETYRREMAESSNIFSSAIASAKGFLHAGWDVISHPNSGTAWRNLGETSLGSASTTFTPALANAYYATQKSVSEAIDEKVAAAGGGKGSAKDAVISPKAGVPHFITGGSKVTPINDGMVSAKTHPNDEVISMMRGGVLWEAINTGLKDGVETVSTDVNRLSQILAPVVSRDVYERNNRRGAIPKDVNINFSGSIRVEGENGQTVTLMMDELENNPVTRRSFFNLMAMAFDSGENGGKRYDAGRAGNSLLYNS